MLDTVWSSVHDVKSQACLGISVQGMTDCEVSQLFWGSVSERFRSSRCLWFSVPGMKSLSYLVVLVPGCKGFFFFLS